MALDRQQQARVCLTDAHARCDRFLAYVGRHGGMTPGRSSLADGLTSTRMVLAPEPTWRGIAGQARRARSGPAAMVGAAVTVVGIGSVALATGMLDATGDPRTAGMAGASPAGEPSTSPTPTPRPTPTASPSLAPTPSPNMTPVPTAVETAPPAPPPTAPPPPPPQQTYTVQQGDTLAAIAQQFGTTVQALQTANGIEDPNEILIGQVLVIA